MDLVTPLSQRLRGTGTTDYGRAVRRGRLSKRWSQYDLAAAASVTQATISGLETGRHQPNLKTLRALDKALGQPVESFLKESA